MKLQLPCKHFSSLLYYNIIKWYTFCFQSETKQVTQKGKIDKKQKKTNKQKTHKKYYKYSKTEILI